MKYINKDKFPYEKPRKVQANALKVIDDNWDKYKYIVMELPTGIGKSAIAKTICSSVDKGFIITSTKQLQDQYLNDFKDSDIVSIKGKQNYKCYFNQKLTCESGYCLVKRNQLNVCKKTKKCPYYSLRDKALASNCMLTTYQYFLRAVDCANIWKPRNVLIFDECHLLENQIVEWASINLSLKELNNKYNIFNECDIVECCEVTNIPEENASYDNKMKWIKKIKGFIEIQRINCFNEVKKILNLHIKDPNNIPQEQLLEIIDNNKYYYELDKFYKKLQYFLKSSSKKSDNWIINKIDDGYELIPIDISDIFYDYLDCMAFDKIIFMSATILDLKKYCNILKLPKEETLLLRCDSTFDPSHAPIIYRPICKMNYNEINNNLDKICEAVKKILDEHPNEKGIIHSGNSKISKYLMDNIKSDRLLVRYGDVINNTIIKEHIISKKPTVLVSSSLSEGIDLKDDLSRFQIIIKLPFGNLSNPRINKIANKDYNWYTLEMFKVFVQQCGRSIRSNNDYAVTYVLDNSFEYFINRNKKLFYKQFLKRIIWKE